MNSKLLNGPQGLSDKRGRQATPLDRGKGMSETVGALGNKTRSQHPGDHSVAYHYGGVSGYGKNENVKGYGERG